MCSGPAGAHQDARNECERILSSLRHTKGNKLHSNGLPLIGLNPVDAP